MEYNNRKYLQKFFFFVYLFILHYIIVLLYSYRDLKPRTSYTYIPLYYLNQAFKGANVEYIKMLYVLEAPQKMK